MIVDINRKINVQVWKILKKIRLPGTWVALIAVIKDHTAEIKRAFSFSLLNYTLLNSRI